VRSLSPTRRRLTHTGGGGFSLSLSLSSRTQTALNGGTSIAALGAHAPARVWATTHCEGLTLWDWGAACDEDDPAGGVGALAEVGDARPAALAAAAAGGGAGTAAAAADTPGALVGCAAVGPARRLTLAAAPPGGRPGALALFPLSDPPTRGGAPLFGSPEAVLAGAHADAVRAWAWLGDAGGGGGPLAAATGGEDGAVALWGRPGSSGVRIWAGAARGGAPAPATPAVPLPMGASPGGGGGGAAGPGPAAASGGAPLSRKGGLKKGSVRRRSTPSG